MTRRSLSLAAILYLMLAVSALAHDGENHSHGSDTSSLWLGAIGVVVVGALVFSLVRRHDPPASIDPADRDTRGDARQ